MCNQNLVNEQKLSIPKIIILGLAPGLVVVFWYLFFRVQFSG